MGSDLDKAALHNKNLFFKSSYRLFLHQQARRSSLLSVSFVMNEQQEFQANALNFLRKRRVVCGVFDRSAVPLSELKSIKPTSYHRTAIASLGE